MPAVFEPWARVLIGPAQPRPGEHVLDAACGTAVAARLVAPVVGKSGRTVGLDFDPMMIAVAKSLGPDIGCQEGDLQGLPFADEPFDLVICRQGLQFLPDRDAGLKEIYRVIRSGGRIVLGLWTELTKSPGHAVLFGALGALLGVDMAQPPPWSLADGTRVLKLVSAAGFIGVETTVMSSRATFPSARRFVEIMIDGCSRLTRQALARVPPVTELHLSMKSQSVCTNMKPVRVWNCRWRAAYLLTTNPSVSTYVRLDAKQNTVEKEASFVLGGSAALSSGLGSFPAYAPSSRCQCEGAILAIPQQALSQTSFELLAAILGKRHDVSAPGACAFRKRLPIVVE